MKEILQKLLNEILEGTKAYEHELKMKGSVCGICGKGSKSYVNKRIELMREYLKEAEL